MMGQGRDMQVLEGVNISWCDCIPTLGNVCRSAVQPKRRSKPLSPRGEQFPAKFGRTGFRRNFQFDQEWRGRHYRTKQVEAYAVQEGADWLVITVITRYF